LVFTELHMAHAYKEAVRAATLADCTEVEHGTLAADDDLRLMVEKGTYFDPQCGLVIENYLQNRERYLGTQGYTAEGFAAMEKILPMDHEIVEHAAKTPELKVVLARTPWPALTGAMPRSSSIACVTAVWTRWQRWSLPTRWALKR
jgi:hypothetical protein